MRAYCLAVGLARAGAVVDICCPWHPQLPLQPFEREGVTIRPFLFATNALPAILGDRIVPPLLQLSWQPFASAGRLLLTQGPLCDIAEFHFCAHPSWMTRVAGQTRVVYAAHNVERDYALAAPVSFFPRWFARRVRELERRAVQASDLVVTCTEADAARMAELYGNPKAVATVPNGFDERNIWEEGPPRREESRARLGLQPGELAILFVGGPAAHNRRAVRFLEHELLPRLRRPARLLVAGQCARPRRDDRVLAFGLVERLGPLLAAADVAVNPVDSGSGSNVKLAEYLAAGLPVVTTAIGLRGYEAFAHLTTVAELGDFAEVVSTARRTEHRRPALAELSWDALGRRLYDIYTDLVAQRPRSHAG